MLPRHLTKGHNIPPEEVDAHLPPTYRRRTRSSQPDDEVDPDATTEVEEDEDDPAATTWVEEDLGSDSGDDHDYVPSDDDETPTTDEGDPEGDVALSGDDEPVRGNTPPGARFISGPELAVALDNLAKKKGLPTGISPGVQAAASAAQPQTLPGSRKQLMLKLPRYLFTFFSFVEF